MSNTDGSLVMSGEIQGSKMNSGSVQESASSLTERVHGALDGATQHVVQELDDLIQELEAMKDHVIKSGDITKERIARHINIAPEAHDIADNIRARFAVLFEGNPNASGTA